MPAQRRRTSQRALLTGRGPGSGPGGTGPGGPTGLAVGYVRVSQAREAMISPEIQRDAITAWAARAGESLDGFVEDLDLSGRSFARRSVAGIIERVERGEVSTVVVYNFSRFGRHTLESLTNLARIEAAGGQIVSATEPIDSSTAIGRFGRTNLLSVAELQSETISAGWVAVHANRVSRGLPGSGRDRFGYTYHRATVPGGRLCPQGCGVGDCQTGYVLDPDTGPVLRGMYDDYLAGRGFGKIANRLNSEGLRTGRGTVWRIDSVSRILDAGFGAGLVFAHGEWRPGVHEPVISPAEWAAYREQRAVRSTVPARSREPLWELAGLVRCGRCGGRMTVVSRPRQPRYLLRCATESLAGSSVCAGVWIKRAAADDAVLEWLDGWAQPIEQAVRVAVAAAPVPGLPDPARERRRLERQVADAETALERLADAVGQGMPLADYLLARGRVQADLDGARARLAAAEAACPRVPRRPEVRRLRRSWPGLSVRARRDVLRSLLVAVVVAPRDEPGPRVQVVPRPELAR